MRTELNHSASQDEPASITMAIFFVILLLVDAPLTWFFYTGGWWQSVKGFCVKMNTEWDTFPFVWTWIPNIVMIITIAIPLVLAIEILHRSGKTMRSTEVS